MLENGLKVAELIIIDCDDNHHSYYVVGTIQEILSFMRSCRCDDDTKKCYCIGIALIPYATNWDDWEDNKRILFMSNFYDRLFKF